MERKELEELPKPDKEERLEGRGSRRRGLRRKRDVVEKRETTD